jgi:hypothetical protein
MAINDGIVETQNVPCLFCSREPELPGALIRDYLTKHSETLYEYIDCECGMTYLRNQPLESQIHKLYQFSYGAYSSDTGLVSKLRDARSRNLQQKVSKSSTNNGNVGILDFGCGSGNFLKAVKSQAKYLVGFEFQANPELEAKSEIIKIYSEEDLTSVAKVHYIYMFQVIEHLADPGRILKLLNEIADDNAKLIIETPIYAGLIVALFPKKYWGGWHAPRHFSIFSEKTLERVLTLNGWNLTSKKYVPSPYQWLESLRPIFRKVGIPEKYLNLNNFLLVSIFYTFDLISVLIGRKSSNVQVIATKSNQKD